MGSSLFKTVAIDTPGGKRNLKMKIKAQQMTFRQDITKYKMYWLTFRCIVHNIFRAIKLTYKHVLYIYTNSFKRLQYSNKRIRGRMKNNLSLVN
jgi:ribosomal protein L6P/L9E